MRSKFPQRVKLALLLVVLAGSSQLVIAQSSIINVPTTDVLPRRKVYIEADYFVHPTPYSEGGFNSGGPTIIYGLAKDIEVGVNLYYTASSEPHALELQPNVKWRFYSDEESGFAAAIGGLTNIPLKNRESTPETLFLYGSVSKQVRGTFGPRITTGAFTWVGRMGEGENRSGIMLGYEQPVYRKLSFIADWLSGDHYLGYGSAGLLITLPSEGYFHAGYSFGNKGRGNNFLEFYLGKTF